jgi:PAS domain S-box-containing protein
MESLDRHALLAAADRAGLGVVVAHLAPPRIVHANSAAAALFGMSAAELYEREPFDLVEPEQRDLVAQRVKERLSGENPPPVQVTLNRNDGKQIVVDCRVVDLEGMPRSVAVFFSAAPERLVDLAADARYRAIVDAAPDGVTITRGTRFLYANDAALGFAHCKTFAEMSNKSIADLILPEDLPTFRERTAAMMRDHVRFPPRDYVLRTGTTVEISSVAIEFEGAPAVLAFVRDVTRARQEQAEIERTQRLVALGTLVAAVAHDVNNPLQFANLNAELLAKRLEGAGEAERAALANLQTGLDRIASLVTELRRFGRPDDSGFTQVALSDVIESAVRMTAASIHARARLELDVAALPSIVGNRHRLEQVMVNVLINASQSFEREDPEANHVRLRASRANGMVIIAVEDNGRGIEREHLPRVFDPFFTTKTHHGMGLGLSICHTIVTQHGGRLDIASVAGEGTSVTIVLPE